MALVVMASMYLQEATDRIRLRFQDEDGQTAAEWLGIIVVVASIIAVLATTEIGERIRDAVLDTVTNIFEGSSNT